MGAEQSKSKEEDQGEVPLDYYELLQVDIEATPEEIKVGTAVQWTAQADNRNHTGDLQYVSAAHESQSAHPTAYQPPRQESRPSRGGYEAIRRPAAGV